MNLLAEFKCLVLDIWCKIFLHKTAIVKLQQWFLCYDALFHDHRFKTRVS